MSAHSSVINLSELDPISPPCCAGTTPARGHIAHGGGCIFAQPIERIMICAYGSDPSDPACPKCKDWTVKQRASYRRALQRLRETPEIARPGCWSSVLDEIFSPSLSQSDLEDEGAQDEPVEAVLLSPTPQGQSQSDPNLVSTSQGSQEQVMVSSADHAIPQSSQASLWLTPELLQQIQLLQTPAAQAMLQQLQGDSGSQTDEDWDPNRIAVIHWAKNILPTMVASSGSVLPGSFALQDSTSSASLLKADNGVLGAFLRGLNLHRSIPADALLPEVIVSELETSLPVLSSQKNDQHLRTLRPLNSKFFKFSNPALASFLSKDALIPKGVAPHQDWGNAPMPTAASPQWRRTADGLAFMLEAAALVDLLITLEGDSVDENKAQMLRNLRNLILSTSSILGSQGHDVLMSRREQILEKFNQPNKQALMQEPFLPGKILGDEASAQLQKGPDPYKKVAQCIESVARSRSFSPRGRGWGSSPSRQFFNSQPRFQQYNYRGNFRGNFRGNIRGNRGNRGGSQQPGSQQPGSSRGSFKRSASFGNPASKKKRF